MIFLTAILNNYKELGWKNACALHIKLCHEIETG